MSNSIPYNVHPLFPFPHLPSPVSSSMMGPMSGGHGEGLLQIASPQIQGMPQTPPPTTPTHGPPPQPPTPHSQSDYSSSSKHTQTQSSYHSELLTNQVGSVTEMVSIPWCQFQLCLFSSFTIFQRPGQAPARPPILL